MLGVCKDNWSKSIEHKSILLQQLSDTKTIEVRKAAMKKVSEQNVRCVNAETVENNWLPRLLCRQFSLRRVVKSSRHLQRCEKSATVPSRCSHVETVPEL